MKKKYVLSIMWQLFTVILFSVSTTTSGRKVADERERIINGSFTPIEEIPWQVAHVVLQDSGPDKLVCGGSIIAMNKILTAGHCLMKPPPEALKRSYYRAGSSYYDLGGSIHHINTYIVHPEYSVQQGIDFYLQNDIAIVKVKEPFIYSNVVKPVAIHNKYPPNFAKAQISGWGITNPYILNSTAKYLLSDKISILKPFKCLSELGINILNLPRNFYCLGEKGGNVGGCYGDSGGPITLDKKLIGIVSAAMNLISTEDSGKIYSCGYKITATIVQAVAPYVKWINDNAKSL